MSIFNSIYVLYYKCNKSLYYYKITFALIPRSGNVNYQEVTMSIYRNIVPIFTNYTIFQLFYHLYIILLISKSNNVITVQS